MSTNSNFGREAFYSGIKYYDNGEYEKARACFKISIKNPRFQEGSIYKLIKIDLKEEKFAQVRDYLKTDHNLNDSNRNQLYGLLEQNENNFKTSHYYFEKCLNDPNNQFITFLEIAKVYIQLGDYTIAQKMLETLQLNNKYTTSATFELIYLKIYEGNYEEAYALLKKVNFKSMSTYSLQYKLIEFYLQTKLDNFSQIYNPISNYWRYRLFEKGDDSLKEHLKKHLNPEEQQTNGCFFENTDLNELLCTVKEKINNMNPYHFMLSDIYRFRFDYPIGYKGDSLTSDIAVSTILDTKKIVTMYPIQLSSEYNREGFVYDQTLSLKRKQGMK